MDTILLCTQNTGTRDIVCRAVGPACRVHSVATAGQLWDSLERFTCECLLVDLQVIVQLADWVGEKAHFRGVIGHLKGLRPKMGIVILATPADMRQVVIHMKSGADNYLTEPVSMEETQLVLGELSRALNRQSEQTYLHEHRWLDDRVDIVQTHSPLMKKIYGDVKSVGPTKATVLLLGETGTGKSVTAKLIHRCSNRKDGPFVSVHCGAIPDTLIESELFGHEKGAFTGAHRRKAGKFELATGGTIFLDEIGTVSKSAQIKLLTVLQDGVFQRVGGEQNLTANVRVIAASNSDLKQMSAEGLFRKDLYYRLNVFPITIPQLCERKEDIPLFVNAFIEKFNRFNAKRIEGVHPDVMNALMGYDWPGNIRELENLVERAHILETTTQLTPESFPSELFDPVDPLREIAIDASDTLAMARKKALAEIERRYLKAVLERNNGKINLSAAEAGVSTRQLNKLMHRHNLDKGAFKGRRTVSG